eukprot:752631-Hanusia_phi.AAC.2
MASIMRAEAAQAFQKAKVDITMRVPALKFPCSSTLNEAEFSGRKHSPRHQSRWRGRNRRWGR